MASNALGRGPVDIEVTDGSGDASKQGELHQDVEVGPEVIVIDRIEEVYK